MIKVIPFNSLGHANHGWLDAHHHFSFAEYRDPARMGFGLLRVLNDDTIAPHSGFPPHEHHDMEIITYIRKGAITHEDNLGHQGRIAAGEVQVMSAGSGITHAEFNREDEETQLFQIWIFPNQKNVSPRWESKLFPQHDKQTALTLLVSGYAEDKGKDALFIHQAAALYGAKLSAGQTLTHPLRGNAYGVLSHGSATFNNVLANARDGIEITQETSLTLHAETDCELILIEV